MRVLLDECVPRPLKYELSKHDVSTVQEAGWAGRRNGELLSLIRSSAYEVFVTTDQSIEKQQNVRKMGVRLIVLVAKSNKLESLLPLLPALRAALVRVAAGEVMRIEL